MHCEGPGVADWFKESTITTRNLYSFSLLECSPLQPGERSLLGQSPASASGGEQTPLASNADERRLFTHRSFCCLVGVLGDLIWTDSCQVAKKGEYGKCRQ